MKAVPRCKYDQCSGFTLLELLIVLAVVAQPGGTVFGSGCRLCINEHLQEVAVQSRAIR